MRQVLMSFLKTSQKFYYESKVFRHLELLTTLGHNMTFYCLFEVFASLSSPSVGFFVVFEFTALILWLLFDWIPHRPPSWHAHVHVYTVVAW